jgi:hypothetical protein
MIDPGITRPNSVEAAWASLKTLQTISQNLIREPDNPKFRQFKPTNNTIKARLMDTKGALEYAIALGFRPEVQNFQPYYVFNPKKMNDLKLGAAILQEHMELETAKQERQAQAKREEKAVREAAVKNVKLAFMDDRKSKSLFDERDKQARARREAVNAELARSPGLPSLESGPAVPNRRMPGSGHMLTGEEPPTNAGEEEEQSPPPYKGNSDGEEDEDEEE